MKQRIDAIDIAKGLGILLVYIGHVPPCKFVVHFIYNFHMPLFFFLSGIFLDEKKYEYREFFVSRCKTLLIPYAFFIAFAIALHLIPDFDVLHPRLGLGGAALWFLPVLFLSELVVFLFWKLTDSKRWRVSFCILLMVVAVIISKIEIMLPFKIQSLPMAALFYAFGSLTSKEVKKYYVTKVHKYDHVLALVCIAILIVCALFLNSYTNMYYGRILLNGWGIIVALAGIAVILVISKFIDLSYFRIKNILLLLGKNSLIIFGTHLAYKDLFLRIFGEMKPDYPYNYLLGNVVMVGGGCF